ncbi:MAG: CSLREA domain-containing protein, partial [Betaproteobacteria bacterium]
MPRIRFVATTIASLVLSFVPFVLPGALAATISVNSIADVVANDGQCTLREAIIAANSNTASGAAAGECAAGQGYPTIDVIAFNIPGAGVHTIVPTTTLPGITEIVTIDGYTQPGSRTNSLAAGNDATLLIEIDVRNVPNDPVLTLHCCNSGGSTVRGLVLSHFTGVGIQVGDDVGNGANGVTITGNFIGTNPAGTALSGGGTPISVVASTATVIGGATPALRNVIAGTAGGGGSMIVLDASDGNTIQGNYIGVNAAGTAGLGGANGAIGLVLSSFNLIGGAAAGAGNVIAGYTAYGISLEGNGNRVQGNFIGTNATGTAGLAAGGYGIIAGASTGAQIGGGAAGAGNLISGNGKSGIKVMFAPLSLLIQGNKIGTDLAGTG